MNQTTNATNATATTASRTNVCVSSMRVPPCAGTSPLFHKPTHAHETWLHREGEPCLKLARSPHPAIAIDLRISLMTLCGATELMIRSGAQRAASLGIDAGEFRAQQDYLRGVVNPEKRDDERSGRAVDRL